MLITEQTLKNKGRIYYRGLKDFDENYRRFDETYLTTKFIYALCHSKINGYIESYCLKDTANIFNMKYIKDEEKLRAYCQKKLEFYKIYLKYFDALKNNDWSGIFGDTGRQQLIWAIKNLGYDGYFNFEIDENLYKELKKYPFCKYSKSMINSPAVCVFDINKSMQKIETISGNKIKNNPLVTDLKKQEKINLIMNVDDYKNEENPFAFLRDRILTLSDEELKDTINKALKKENILEQSLRKEEVLKSFEKRYFNY